jgi:hypothetical protein
MAAYRTFSRRVGHARWFAYAVRYALSGVDRRIHRASKGRMGTAGRPAAWRFNREADPRVTAQVGGERRRSGERHVFVLGPGA